MKEGLPRLEVVEGEFGFPLELSIVDVDNDVVVLAGDETVTMAIKKPGDSAAVEVGTGSIYNAAGGVVRITLGSADVADLPAGRYMAMVSVETETKVLRTLPFWLVVHEAVVE
jgi:hypothetical protein